MNFFVKKKIGNRTYVVFLPLLWFTVLLLLFIAVYGLYSNGWSLASKYYVSCDSKTGCVNPFYLSNNCIIEYGVSDPLCAVEFLNYGESFGVKPDFFVKYSSELVFGLLSFFLIINTLVFNIGFFKGFEV